MTHSFRKGMSQMGRERGTEAPVPLLLPLNPSSRAFWYRQAAFSACNRIKKSKEASS